MFNDPKTTITGIITGLVTLASHYNIVISADWQTLIIAAGVLIMGLFAKDAKKGSIV